LKTCGQIIFVLCLAFTGLIGQSSNSLLASNPAETSAVVEEMPEPYGGIGVFYKYISSHIVYPRTEMEAGISGKTYIKFVVERDGSLSDFQVLKGVLGCKACDNEAIRVIKNYPEKWKPGKQNGQLARVYYTLPIIFKVGRPTGQNLTHEEQQKQNSVGQWGEGVQFEREYKYKEAFECYEKSLSMDPDNRLALFDKAKMQLALGEKDKACTMWKEMINEGIRKNEAQVFMKTYCNDKFTARETAVNYHNFVKCTNFFNVGMSAVNSSSYEVALRNFDSCLVYNPENKDALYNKAVMHIKLGQKGPACVSWKKLLTLNPQDKETEDLIKKNCN